MKLQDRLRRSFDRRPYYRPINISLRCNSLWFNERRRVLTRTSSDFPAILWYVTFAARNVNYACLSVWEAFPFARIKSNAEQTEEVRFLSWFEYIPRIIKAPAQEIDKSHFKIITIAIISPEILFMPFFGHHTLNCFIIKLFRRYNFIVQTVKSV